MPEIIRPRIKPEHRAYRTVDGNVRIGSVIHGIGAEIADPEGWVWTLVEAMDGSRGPSAVVDEVVRAHPGLPGADARQAMADLLDAGFVDDAGAAVPVPERERIRYSRGVPLLRWMDLGPRPNPWDAQLRLRDARVLLIGVGGTGGHAAQSLVASGVGRLHLVDPDVVELSNLNRQPLFRESDLGRPKAEAAVATLRALNSDVTVSGERREVREVGDLAELVRSVGEGPPGSPAPDSTASDSPTSGSPAPDSPTSAYDLLVLSADRPDAIRRWANRVCLGAGLPWTLLLLHECAHLVTARATGVPGRMRLGTRLQFLVMQTDISGIELAPRRHRLTAYLAGIATNLTAASLAALAAAATHGTPRRVLAAVTLLALLPLPFQLMVFMRTDLYFVLQDLTRCRDLYGDGLAYTKYAARRVLGRKPVVDPSRELPAHERRAVRTYSVVLAVGTTLCLAFLATVTLPADVTLFARAVAGLGPGHSAGRRLDATAVVVTLGGVHALWAYTWWRGRRVSRGTSRP